MKQKSNFYSSKYNEFLIVYKLGTWSQYLNVDFTLKDCLFGKIKLAKNADPDQYSYSGYGIGFDYCSLFSHPSLDCSKNFIIFGLAVLVLGKGPTQGLDSIMTMA